MIVLLNIRKKKIPKRKHETTKMKFRIRHESRIIYNSLLITAILFCASFVFLIINISYMMVVVAFTLMMMSCLLYFTEQVSGTVIKIQNGYLKISHILQRRKIDLSEIGSVNVENYKRSRKNGYVEYRMRMTIKIYGG